MSTSGEGERLAKRIAHAGLCSRRDAEENTPLFDFLGLSVGSIEADMELPDRQQQYARALARSACAEIHSGFVALRSHLSMDLARDQELAELPAEAQADIDRVCRLWADCRQRFGQDGAFLFGHASIADAFFAPVAARLRSYRVALPAEAAAYVETIYQWPAFRRWYQAALQEVQG